MSEASKQGYSLWSLMVMTSLLAILLAIPRHSGQATFNPKSALFFFWHQLALWVLIASIIWLTTGKRRSVRHIMAVLITILWLPLLSALLEDAFTGGATRTWSALSATGLYEGYGMFYQTIFRICGYGS